MSVSLFDLVDTWNDPTVNFRAIRMNAINTASGAGSLLLELLVNGSNRFFVRNDGVVEATGQVRAESFNVLGGLGATISGAGVTVASGLPIQFSSTASASGAPDVILRREAANELGIRNGVNPQAIRIYNTFTDISNNERGTVGWNSNILELATASAGTGVIRTVRLRSGAATAGISSSGAWVSSGSFQSATGNFMNTNSGSHVHVSGSADGIIALFNNGQTGFNRLQFGGFTSAYPAIKRSGNQLDCRLADDSGWATIASGGFRPSVHNVQYTGIDNIALVLNSAGTVYQQLRAGSFGLGLDVFLERDASDILAIRKATSSQTFRVYNTFTNSSNHERGTFGWVSNVLRIGTERAGTGSGRGLALTTNGTDRLSIGSTGSFNLSVLEYSCTSSGEHWSYGTQIGFQSNTNTLFLHSTTNATIRIEHVNKVFTPTTSEWSLGSFGNGHWNSGYIDTLYLHNTLTDADNWERGSVTWASNALRIATERAGTGVARPITFWTSGLERMRIAADGRLDYVYQDGAIPGEDLVRMHMTNNGNNMGEFRLMLLDRSGDTFPTASINMTPEEGVIIDHPYIQLGTLDSLVALPGWTCTAAELRPTGSNAVLGRVNATGYVPIATANINNLFLHNTFTNTSNYERGFVRWVSNVLEIATERLGTGSARPIIFRTNGTNRMQLGAAGALTINIGAAQNFTVTGLPTVNPNVAGALWNDAGTLKVSAG